MTGRNTGGVWWITFVFLRNRVLSKCLSTGIERGNDEVKKMTMTVATSDFPVFLRQPKQQQPDSERCDFSVAAHNWLVCHQLSLLESRPHTLCLSQEHRTSGPTKPFPAHHVDKETAIKSYLFNPSFVAVTAQGWTLDSLPVPPHLYSSYQFLTGYAIIVHNSWPMT